MKNGNLKRISKAALICAFLSSTSVMAQLPSADADGGSCRFTLGQAQDLLNQCLVDKDELAARYNEIGSELAAAQITILESDARLAEVLTEQASCEEAVDICTATAASCQATAAALTKQIEELNAQLAAANAQISTLSAQTAPENLIVKKSLIKVIKRLKFLALKPTNNLKNKTKVTVSQGLAIAKQYTDTLGKKNVKVVVKK